MKQLSYRHTIFACYGGYITQAIANSFIPLLFLTFQKDYAIGLDKITLLVTVTFTVSLIVDLLSAHFIDRLGYRRAIVAAHILAALGIAGLGIFPRLFPSPYAGLLTAVIIYSVGSGIIEVLISPIVQAAPTGGKAAAMSLLHSFFCWGCVAVIVLSTLIFALLGIERWHFAAYFWALIPAVNAFFFLRVPIAKTTPDGTGMTVSQLLKSRAFWVFALLMLCAGSSEQAMSQWASAFAESALGVSKTVGDLAGPCFFAVMMGFARLLHARLAERVSIERYMVFCALLCVFSYAAAAFVPLPLFGLLGCGLCGFAVGVMWPGTFSLASAACPRGGTAMFALLALFGDLGCSIGPSAVGFISGAFGDNLKAGLAFAIIFPLLLVLGIGLLRRGGKKTK